MRWGLLSLALLGGGDRPGLAAVFNVVLQSRQESHRGTGDFTVSQRSEVWEAGQTAVIVCDMWDLHHCRNAVDRVGELVPRMNQVLEKARTAGAVIIHAPSDCMKAYALHPGRLLAKSLPTAANLPAGIGSWCSSIPAEERAVYPIDQSDGGEDDDPSAHVKWAAELKSRGLNPGAPWTHQADGLRVQDGDYITDSGVEVWNILEARGLRNVILMGVHVNMCVSGRPFGLRQLGKNGRHVVLMRDMTDSMYNPARFPYVNHFRGTALYVEHVEKYLAPTITSDQILGGSPFRFRGDPTLDIQAMPNRLSKTL